MKIDLTLVDLSQFMVHPHIFNGETMYLIQPQFIGTKWTQDNKHFRSSVYNISGELVSASFFKFVNFGENPENFPVPTSLKNTNIVEKIDGSLTILSKYKGNYIIRTRGTLDASLMEKNGFEIEIFKQTILPKIEKLAHLFGGTDDTWNSSILTEWVSPINKIVIRYPEPDWYLIGIVHHSDYSLATQLELNNYACEVGLKRPENYTFPSVEELIKNVEQFKGKEGVVLYSKNDQMLHKIKGLDYLCRHRLKSELGSFEKLVDFWFTIGNPVNYQVFFDEIVKLVDYETAIDHQGDISKIIDASKGMHKIMEGMTEFVNGTVRALPTRKDQALKITSSYGNSGEASRSGMCFKILDNKPLTQDDKKKLLYQTLKCSK